MVSDAAYAGGTSFELDAIHVAIELRYAHDVSTIDLGLTPCSCSMVG